MAYCADHEKYDGILKNDKLKGFFFNSGMYNTEKPTLSQYPRGGTKGENYPRYFLQISRLGGLKKYHMYLVKDPTIAQYTQVHIAVVHKKNRKVNKFMKNNCSVPCPVCYSIFTPSETPTNV